MSYISNLVHFIWSTASRARAIKPEWESRLHGYVGGILNNSKAKFLAAGGMEDHPIYSRRSRRRSHSPMPLL